MKPFIFIFLLLFSITSAFGQSKATPEKILMPTNATMLQQSLSTVHTQTKNWEEEATENPQSTDAWLHYAIWTQRNLGLTAKKRQEQLATIVRNASTYISNSGEYALIRFLQTGKTDSAALYMAYEKMADKSIVLPFLVQFSLRQQNKAACLKFCLALQALRPIARESALYWYHYNVLQSATPNARLLAAGENDLVPMAQIQAVYGIRTDIELGYYTGAAITNGGKDVFLCLSLGSTILETYKNNSAYRGLLVQIFPEEQEPAHLPLPTQWELRYLQQVHAGAQALLHNNYLPSLLLAYWQEKKRGSDKVSYYQQLIEKIAREGGLQEKISHRLKEERP